MALDFAAGCVAGGAGVLVGFPLDTVKVKIQTQDLSKGLQYRGTFHALTSIVKESGVRGLYRGLSSPLAGVAAINAITFGVYGNALRCFDDPHSVTSITLAGSTAGLLQTFVVSPMELVKTQLQVGGSPTIAATVRHIYASAGARGLARGMGITCTREVPAFGIYFGSYEIMIREYGESTPVILAAGGLAGVLSWVFTYPQDVIKSRLQADGFGKQRKYFGASHCTKAGLEAEGTNFLVRGLNSTIIRAFPMNAVTFYVYTMVIRAFGDDNDGQVADTSAYDTVTSLEASDLGGSKSNNAAVSSASDSTRWSAVTTDMPNILLVRNEEKNSKWRDYPEQMLYACANSKFEEPVSSRIMSENQYNQYMQEDCQIPTVISTYTDIYDRPLAYLCKRKECKCRKRIHMSDFLLPNHLQLANNSLERIYGFYYLLS